MCLVLSSCICSTPKYDHAIVVFNICYRSRWRSLVHTQRLPCSLELQLFYTYIRHAIVLFNIRCRQDEGLCCTPSDCLVLSSYKDAKIGLGVVVAHANRLYLPSFVQFRVLVWRLRTAREKYLDESTTNHRQKQYLVEAYLIDDTFKLFHSRTHFPWLHFVRPGIRRPNSATRFSKYVTKIIRVITFLIMGARVRVSPNYDNHCNQFCENNFRCRNPIDDEFQIQIRRYSRILGGAVLERASQPRISTIWMYVCRIYIAVRPCPRELCSGQSWGFGSIGFCFDSHGLANLRHRLRCGMPEVTSTVLPLLTQPDDIPCSWSTFLLLACQISSRRQPSGETNRRDALIHKL